MLIDRVRLGGYVGSWSWWMECGRDSGERQQIGQLERQRPPSAVRAFHLTIVSKQISKRFAAGRRLLRS